MYCGFSKLEIVSAMALQGLLSNLASLRKEGFKDDDIAEFAILQANKLFDKLEHTENNQKEVG